MMKNYKNRMIFARTRYDGVTLNEALFIFNYALYNVFWPFGGIIVLFIHEIGKTCVDIKH